MNKPCPFCGSEDIKEDISEYSVRFLQCQDCGAIGPVPPIVLNKQAQDFSTYWKILWEEWNKRNE